jgi:leader peptidase (prepilin peptidase) / N-methyltransferase
MGAWGRDSANARAQGNEPLRLFEIDKPATWLLRRINENLIPCSVGCLFVITSLIVSPTLIGVVVAALSIVLLIIAVVDWRYFIIPNNMIISGLLLGLIYAALRANDSVASAVAVACLRAFSFALFLLAVRILYSFIRGRIGLGLGDVKLAAVAGLWLDWLMMPIVLQFAILAALATYLWQQTVRTHPLSMTGKLPFGFFLAPAIWFCVLLEELGIAPV